ncbi:hypothetical protein VMCG_00935 [Cytospora schulzeri]|uniref:Uncharacterized protein n=1 Tax=Cytospora schulzeri TaxID=448051 RepID=A0A423X6R4_9PEZI|nr:hypothetical protein VMCG_00935 [Valsa malicola]
MSSSETLPISPARFAEAIKDLSAASLHLKTLELRNSLAHLAYSNAQLRPFADGTETPRDGGGTPGQPDPDCVDAIRENEAVMVRMRARIGLIRAEVEGRGLSWREFEAKDELEDDDEPGVDAPAAAAAAATDGSAPFMNGVNGHGDSAAAAAAAAATASSGRNPWTDGTFQTGVIRNGEVIMDAVPGLRSGEGATTTTTTTAAAATTTTGSGQGAASGGRLSDEELRRMLEVRLAEDGEDEDGGMHL